MQATRGTSVTDGPGARVPVSRPRGARILLGATFAVAYTADQASKALAAAHLDDGSTHRLVGEALQLHLVRNAGAAFSTGTGYTTVLSCLAIVAVVVVLWIGRRVATTAWALAFGLLLAGIGGNLTDRLVRSPAPLRGQVVDFLQLPHWPIFNVADMSINVAAALVLVQVFRGIRLDGTRADAPGRRES